MNVQEAIEHVTRQLCDLMYEQYEGEEWNEPSVKEWIEKNREAIDLLSKFGEMLK